MDKRQFMPLSFPGSHPPPHLPPSFHHHPLAPLPPPPPAAVSSREEDEEEFEEDVDEDDMSDLEEELQQELLAYRNRQRQPDMTRQLLQFADMVNADIQKFFGRKKGDEDSCDVYEDKWTVTKSGRELYYADLLRMAQGDFSESKSSKSSSKARHKDADTPEDNRHSFSGKADSSKGLGGLKDLFDLGLRGHKDKSSSSHHGASAKRQRTETDSVSGLVPMHQRRLPESFWREPGLAVSGPPGTGSAEVPVVTSSVLQSLGASKLPDFSDLMESWHGEQSQVHQHQLHPLHQIQQQHLQQHQQLQQQQQHRNSAISETFTSSSSDSSSSRKRRL